MGMYTTVLAKVNLLCNTPKEKLIIETLKLMLEDEPISFNLPDEKFFKTDGWRLVLYVFSDFADCEDYPERSKLTKNEDGTYTLDVVSVNKYPNAQDELLKMLAKHSNSEGIVGTLQYEEWDNPMNIEFHDKQLFIKDGEEIYHYGGRF